MIIRNFHRLVFASILLLAATSRTAGEGSGGINAPDQRGMPYLILVSIDGFRWDYQDLYETPGLDWIAANGVRAERMIPVFPTLTFPNHYSIATGLYPARHGLIGNRFPNADRTEWYSLYDRATVQDGRWYGGEPVWVAAEKAGMVTAAYYFVGTEAAIQGLPMTYWKTYDDSISGMDRVQQVVDWLAMPDERRPHLITLYFEDVDRATHDYGPGSPESVAAIQQVDGYLDALVAGISELPIQDEIYLVVVSDHGQLGKKVDEEILVIDQVIDTSGLSIVDHGAAAFIYFSVFDAARAREVRDAINAEWNHGKAILREDAPEQWRVTREAGFADILVQADPGYLVYSSANRMKKHSLGDHGWAPETEAMHGIFLATGPRLPKGTQTGPISVVDVYPLLMAILGLPLTSPIDGDRQKLEPLLGERLQQEPADEKS